MTESKKHPTERDVFTIKRFRQVMWAVFFLTVLHLINIFLGDNETKLTKAIVVSGVMALIGFNFYLTKIDKEALARVLFLWTLILSVTYVSWLNGALGDTSMMRYPLLVIYSIFLGGIRLFFPTVAFLILSVLLLGANAIYGWIPSPPRQLGWDQVIDATLIIMIAAYASWTVNSDFNATLRNLNIENDKVLKSRATIQLMAERDALTGLHNRPACETYYKKATAELNDNEQIILLFLDLDNFKSVNDSFGHNAGDGLLITIAEELKRLLQPSDLACRLSGDEFVLIIKRNDLFNIDQFADGILKAINTPYHIHDSTIRMTGSVGIAIASDDRTEFDEMRKKADIAMYKSKQMGKNTFSYYSKRLQEENLRKTSILTGLKDALENNLLDLHTQPKVNLSTNKIESAEALMRWNRSNPYNFTPGEFIPVIESTELIHEIGKWGVEEACRICRRWHDAGFDNMSIAVNVSSVQLMRSNFSTLVFKALQESGLAPQFLEIELTEHVLIQHNKTVKNQLKYLKDLGVQLSIDDFGTGYSNLSYLINFKVDTIKLDQSFIAKVNTSSEHFAVVKAVIQMAQILDLSVVAEGVESEAVKQVLIDLKCDYGQGYLWSKALPEGDFIKEVARFNGDNDNKSSDFIKSET